MSNFIFNVTSHVHPFFVKIREFLYCIFRWIFARFVNNWSELFLLTNFKESYIIRLFQQIS